MRNDWIRMMLAAGWALTAMATGAAAGLNTNVAVATQSINFLNPGHCNQHLFDFNLFSLGLNSQSCSAILGAATLSADADAWAVYGMVGGSVNITANGTDSSLMGGVVGSSSAIFSDSPVLNVPGLNLDDPVNVTLTYTVTGSKSASHSPNFSGASAPNNIQQSLVLMLGQDGGPNLSQVLFDNFTAGNYQVTYTLANQRQFFVGSSLFLQYQFPELPPAAGPFSAAASFNYFGTVQMTQISVSAGPTTYSNFSMTGGTGTNYLNVLTAPHPFASPVPEPSTGVLAAGAMALLGLAWRRRGGRRQTADR